MSRRALCYNLAKAGPSQWPSGPTTSDHTWRWWHSPAVCPALGSASPGSWCWPSPAGSARRDLLDQPVGRLEPRAWRCWSWCCYLTAFCDTFSSFRTTRSNFIRKKIYSSGQPENIIKCSHCYCYCCYCSNNNNLNPITKIYLLLLCFWFRCQTEEKIE